MIDLKDWIIRNVQRPLAYAVGTLLSLQIGYLSFLAYERYATQVHLIDRLVETASLGVQQGNRPLVESTLITGLRSSAAATVALCREGGAELLYPPGTQDPCGRRPAAFHWVIRRKAIGMAAHEFIFVVNGLGVFAPLAVLLAISFALSLAVFWILSRARGRFVSQVLEPLREGLNEEKPLAIRELDELRQRNQAHNELSRKQAVSDAIFVQSAQVAHDIRSPLAALEVAAGDLPEVSEDRRAVIRSAVGRISDIANNLLDRRRAESVKPAAASPQLLSGLLEPVIGEKRLQYRSRSRILIELALADSARECLAFVEPVEFKRLLSNLLNNAVEAVGEGTGTVRVGLESSGGRALISVRDDGKGIPPEVLVKLGRRGETHGKADGSGLGLYHARNSVEAWGGRLELSSEEGRGTTATVVLPLAVARAWDAVLIDDDELVRATWKLSAAKAGKTLRSFATAAEFLNESCAIDRATLVYIDSDLGGEVKGEAEALKIHELGFGEIYLATGHAPEKFAGLSHLRGVVGKEPPWG